MNFIGSVSLAQFKEYSNASSPCYLRWDDDVCTKWPDKSWYFDFTYTCKRHDFGYRNLRRADDRYNLSPNAWRRRNKNVADKQFKIDYKAHCKTRNVIQRAGCRAEGEIMYVGVSMKRPVTLGTPMNPNNHLRMDFVP